MANDLGFLNGIEVAGGDINLLRAETKVEERPVNFGTVKFELF